MLTQRRMKRFVKTFIQSFSRIARMSCSADEQTYYPEEPRKGRWRILFELLVWFLRHQEVNQYYYLYGFDRLALSDHSDYGGEINQRDLRNNLNRRFARGKDLTSYVGLAADKFVNGIYLEALGVPTPKVYALMDSNGIRYSENLHVQMPLNSILERHGLSAVCKEVLGGCGVGFMTIDVNESGSLLLMDQKSTVKDLEKSLYGTHILQERVVQHPDLNTLYPNAVMTLRVVTVFKGGEPHLLAGTVRVGACGGKVDNFHAGGMMGPIDLKTGRLGRFFQFGPSEKGGRFTHHPDTGIQFDGFQLPFVPEAVELCLATHQFFYGIHSIGWDIVFTENGPLILEANDEWMMGLVQFTNGGLRKKFNDLCPEGISY